jgi:hypothetical protein
MAKPEWIPTSPCVPECRERDNYCPPKSRFGCEDYHVYKGSIDAQIQLLDYQIALTSKITDERSFDVPNWLREMWNSKHSVGDKVIVTKDMGEKIHAKTRSEAYLLPSGEAVIMVDGITGCYLLSRVQSDKEWRPQNPYHIPFDPKDKPLRAEVPSAVAWAEGASAMLKAVIQYLMGKCDEHSLEPDNDIKVADLWYTDDKHEYHLHRFNCPLCMKQLQESE